MFEIRYEMHRFSRKRCEFSRHICDFWTMHFTICKQINNIYSVCHIGTHGKEMGCGVVLIV